MLTDEQIAISRKQSLGVCDMIRSSGDVEMLCSELLRREFEELFQSAIRDATKPQAKRIVSLNAALKLNMSRAEKVHELDMTETERLKERIEKLGVFIARMPRSFGIFPWNDGHTSAIQIIEQEFASLFLPFATKETPPTENRPDSHQDGSKKTTPEDKE